MGNRKGCKKLVVGLLVVTMCNLFAVANLVLICCCIAIAYTTLDRLCIFLYLIFAVLYLFQ